MKVLGTAPVAPGGLSSVPAAIASGRSQLVVDGKGSVVEVARPLSCAAVTISSKGTLTGMKPLPTMDSDWCSGESTRQRVFVPDGWTAESGAYLARKRWARIQTRQIPW